MGWLDRLDDRLRDALARISKLDSLKREISRVDSRGAKLERGPCPTTLRPPPRPPPNRARRTSAAPPAGGYATRWTYPRSASSSSQTGDVGRTPLPLWDGPGGITWYRRERSRRITVPERTKALKLQNFWGSWPASRSWCHGCCNGTTSSTRRSDNGWVTFSRRSRRRRRESSTRRWTISRPGPRNNREATQYRYSET